jgi:hypothetical protein
VDEAGSSEDIGKRLYPFETLATFEAVESFEMLERLHD